MDNKSSRIFYIDWLRVLAVFMLIPYHTSRIFDFWEPWYAKNIELSSGLSWFRKFFDPWGMPLLFVAAGAAAYFALGHRSGRQYLSERIKRLLVPFVFGLLVLVPPQAYYALLNTAHTTDSYWQFYPHFFEFGRDPLGYTGQFTPGHLWFILFLFAFAFVALPLFLYFKRESGLCFISRLAAFCEKRGAIFVLAIPLFLTEALPPDLGPMNLYAYLLLFIFGYLLMADDRFARILAREKSVALILGIGSMSIYFAVLASGSQYADFTWPSIGLAVLNNFNLWFWVIVLLGFGQKYLNFGNKWLAYAGEAAYPVYLLHQTVIVIIGFYVAQWTASVALKYGVIAISATIITLGLYEFLVRRTNPVRFLFGLKPKPPLTSLALAK